jgi:DHA3 family macrolide efflux protein-like MFS transporter
MANAVSGFAQGISILAIPWYFASVLKNTSLFGTCYAVITVVSVFWSLYAGTLIDKYSRKKIFIALCLVCGTIILSVASIGYITGQVPAFLVVVVFATTIFNYNIHYPAVYAFGQEVSDAKDYGKLNSKLEIQHQATSILSGAVAAILLSGTEAGNFNLLGFAIHLPFTIVPWQLHDIFLMDAITYFIAIFLLLAIKYSPSGHVHADMGSITERIKTGINFLNRNRPVFIFGNASFSIFVVLIVEVQLLLPMYVNNHLQCAADVYASAEVYYAIGALMAGFFIRKLFANTHTVNAIMLLMLFTVAGFYICAFSKSVLLFYLFSIMIGVTNAGTRVLRVTYLFSVIPNHVIGRVSSVFQVINISLRALFIMLFSLVFFSAGSNITYAFFICGCFVLGGILILLRNRKAFFNPPTS